MKPPVKGGQKVHLFMGMAPRLKTVSNVPMRFPEYSMTNVSNLGGGFPLLAIPKRCGKGAIY